MRLILIAILGFLLYHSCQLGMNKQKLCDEVHGTMVYNSLEPSKDKCMVVRDGKVVEVGDQTNVGGKK